jgi:peptide/nickel transport system permease protein
MVANQVIMAVPPFFSGILISWVFGMVLHLFAPGGYVSYERSFSGFLAYLIYPAFAIALPRAAQTAKLLRGSILEEASKNYTRTAYSRGNTTSGVLYGHVLKNAFLPVLTFLGMSLANMLAGSLVVERVFGIPGISTTLLSSIGNRDYPVVLAIVMWIAAVIIVINLIVDILYRVLDPRIAEEE